MRYIDGNIIDIFKSKKYNCLLHQANCQWQYDGFKRHGAGVARSIALAFPEMVNAENKALIKDVENFSFDEKFSTILKNSKNFFYGGLFSHEQYDNCHIVNLFSQYYFGSPNNKKINTEHDNHVEQYDNLRCRLIALKNSLEIFKSKFDSTHTILIPLIASGIAKDVIYSKFDDLEYFKMIIEPIINESLKDYDITVVVYKP